MYDIQSKRMTPAIPVPKWCTVTQLGNRTFVSGGCSLSVTSTVMEYMAEGQRLVNRESMKYAKYCHRTEAISPKEFVTLGGDNGTTSIAYCENYSVLDDKWSMLPSFNKPRQCTGSALLGRFLYAIGGRGTNGEIERFNIDERKLWMMVNLKVNEITFNSDTLAFPASPEEIIILRGGSSTEVASYNIKEFAIKKSASTLRGDFYRYNPVCQIGRNAYIIGHFGHIHIYKIAEKRFEEIEHQLTMVDQ